MREAMRLILALIISGLVGCASRSSPQPGPPAPAAASTAGPSQDGASQGGEWLERLNYYRVAAGIRAIHDKPSLSRGAYLHARYLVKNYDPKHVLGAWAHQEQVGNQWYSAEGQIAGEQGDVVFGSPRMTDQRAIDGWLLAPFHSFPMLDPRLTTAGFGRFCNERLCVSVLELERPSSYLSSTFRNSTDFDPERRIAVQQTLHGALPPKEVFRQPILFPPEGTEVSTGIFRGGEWPDPLSACPGYSAPTGVIVMASFGNSFSPEVTEHSLTCDGKAVEVCLVNAEQYKNGSNETRDAGRDDLFFFAGVLMIPRDPIAGGSQCVATLANHGKTHRWSFKVASGWNGSDD